MTMLAHKNDVFFIDVDMNSMTLDEIIAELDVNGYKMGKTSLRALLNGEVKEARGFVIAETEDAPVPDEFTPQEVINEVQNNEQVDQTTKQFEELRKHKVDMVNLASVAYKKAVENDEVTIVQEPEIIKPDRKSLLIPTWEGYQKRLKKGRNKNLSYADHMLDCFREVYK